MGGKRDVRGWVKDISGDNVQGKFICNYPGDKNTSWHTTSSKQVHQHKSRCTCLKPLSSSSSNPFSFLIQPFSFSPSNPSPLFSHPSCSFPLPTRPCTFNQPFPFPHTTLPFSSSNPFPLSHPTRPSSLIQAFPFPPPTLSSSTPCLFPYQKIPSSLIKTFLRSYSTFHSSSLLEWN